MLSKSFARNFFFICLTLAVTGLFALSFDTILQIPTQTNEENMSQSVKRGKVLWTKNNCIGCHTLLGEGAYYAPELTTVYPRRGEAFIQKVLKDPQALYPGKRKMEQHDFSDAEIADLIAFLKWISEMDLNQFPPTPTMLPLAIPLASPDILESTESPRLFARTQNRPKLFNQLCLACHALEGQGGNIGPSLDNIGNTLSIEAIIEILKEPKSSHIDAKMPKLNLSIPEVNELAAFLSQRKNKEEE